ncbi:siphovirus Gp157 family protein, partial [Streptomyces albidoflavus]|uniref:siphovirus Gp157 family protein n=1 Tax=Streptomyces albidoflavus TaxID=1886 RepID=UPI00341461B2
AEDDPAFWTLIESETDALELLRCSFRRATLEEAEAEGAKTEVQKIQARIARKLARAETFKSIVLQSLLELGLLKLPAPDFTLSVVAPSTKKVVGAGNVDALPDHLVRISREPNKTAIKEALEQGETVEGFNLANGAPFLRASR